MNQFDDPLIRTLTTSEAAALLPARNPNSHKGTFGRLLIVAGCANYTGAAALATLAALRMGTGIVTLASTARVIAAAGAKLYEPTYLTLPENAEGQIAETALPLLLEAAKNASALLVGCGLGLSQDSRALVAGLLREITLPILLDADGLNSINGQLGLLAQAKYPPVLTPHIGEMTRLTGLTVAELQADRQTHALCFAQENGCVLVLKDADTVIAAPDGRLYSYQGRNAGMARGGSGDVLAGFAASLLAQRMEPALAAAVAVALHGAAGQACARGSSQISMLPHELPDVLGPLLAGFRL